MAEAHLTWRRSGATRGACPTRKATVLQRSFTRPDGIDAEKIAADFKDGVLTISLPKSPELQQKERKIAIQSR